MRRLATGLQTRDERALHRYEVALPRAQDSTAFGQAGPPDSMDSSQDDEGGLPASAPPARARPHRRVRRVRVTRMSESYGPWVLAPIRNQRTHQIIGCTGWCREHFDPDDKSLECYKRVRIGESGVSYVKRWFIINCRPR